MSNVIGLDGKEISEEQFTDAKAAIDNVLSDLKAQAQDGKFDFICGFTTDENGRMSYFRAGDRSFYQMLGMLRYLEQELIVRAATGDGEL